MDIDGEDSSKASGAQKKREPEALNLEFGGQEPVWSDRDSRSWQPERGELSGGKFWLGSGSLFSKPRQNICCVVGQKLLVGGVCAEK